MSTAPPTVRRKKPVGGRGFSAYTEYVPSDIPGVAELPAHWRAKPLKRVVTINAEDLPEATDPDYEIAYVDIGNVALVGGIESTEAYRFEEAPSRARRKARDGDTIISTVRTYLRAVAQIRDPAPNLVVSTGFAVLRPNSEIDAGFLYRLVQCEEFVGRVVAYSTGVSYPAIAPTTLGMFHVWLPPLPEQGVIAAFLDHQTRRIDELIAKKRRLIELLAEKRSALISHAVTKGLNPSAPMKPSGADWLGDVPAHWNIKQLKFAVTFQRGHDLPLDDRCDGDVPIVTSAGPSAWHNEAAARGPGIVTGRYGTIGTFHLVEEDYWPLNTTLYSINLRGNETRFLWYMLHSLTDVFLVNAGKSAVPGVDRNDLHPILVAVPPLEEQRAIASYLDRETNRFDQLASAVQTAIQRLQEHRSALISAAVTGKIDVREEAGV